MKPDPSRLEFRNYPHKIEVQTRFADIDLQRHLNNVRIVEIYQEARASFNLALWEQAKLDGERRRLLVARQCVDYLGEAEWPGTVAIGVGVSYTGNTSFSIGLAMFQAGKCVSVADVVLVHATETGPAPIPEEIRRVLATQMLPPSAR